MDIGKQDLVSTPETDIIMPPSYKCTKGHEWRDDIGLEVDFFASTLFSMPGGDRICRLCFQELLLKHCGVVYSAQLDPPGPPSESSPSEEK